MKSVSPDCFSACGGACFGVSAGDCEEVSFAVACAGAGADTIAVFVVVNVVAAFSVVVAFSTAAAGVLVGVAVGLAVVVVEEREATTGVFLGASARRGVTEVTGLVLMMTVTCVPSLPFSLSAGASGGAQRGEVLVAAESSTGASTGAVEEDGGRARRGRVLGCEGCSCFRSGQCHTLFLPVSGVVLLLARASSSGACKRRIQSMESSLGLFREGPPSVSSSRGGGPCHSSFLCVAMCVCMSFCCPHRRRSSS